MTFPHSGFIQNLKPKTPNNSSAKNLLLPTLVHGHRCSRNAEEVVEYLVNLTKCGSAVSEICMRTNRHTDRHARRNTGVGVIHILSIETTQAMTLFFASDPVESPCR